MWSILKLLREDPEKIKWSQRARGLSGDIVDQALEYDKLWRRKNRELEALKHERNLLSRRIRGATEEEKKRIIEEARKLSEKIEILEREVNDIKRKRDDLLLKIPNIVHESVPIGFSEDENVPIMYYGKLKVWKGHLERFKAQIGDANVEYEVIDYKPEIHADIGEKTRLVDTERAGKVAGSRFYYLLDDLVWLDLALTMYALDYMTKKGFVPVQPPLMMKRKPYEGVISFQDFEDMIYKIEREDLYLIATSEHPIAAMFMNEVIPKKSLPLKFVGVSVCFRKEAGAHGKDTKGIFRVHQFNKVEQFVFCLPEDSWKWHEELIENAIELWKGLEVPFRIVNICTGELGDVAAKKYDLEVWMPGQGKFREVVSCSNCTDYQSYRLNIRYAPFKGAPSEGYVHTLNSTAIATSRAITAVFENHQDEEGRIHIPKVLRKYLELFDEAPKEVIEPLNLAV